jgi:hypothetical protein
MSDEKPIDSVEELIETVVPGLSTAEYEKIREEAIEKAKTTRHQWVMKGRGRLMCKSCPFPHTSFVDPSMILKGIDDQGIPILEKLN